jgi:hypothetical protein
MYLPELTALANLLTPQEKLNLAQKLIQLAEKETSGNTSVQNQPVVIKKFSPNDIADIEARLLKLRPRKLDGVINSIKAMYQMTGGISDNDVSNVIEALHKSGNMSISLQSVTYRTPAKKQKS